MITFHLKITMTEDAVAKALAEARMDRQQFKQMMGDTYRSDFASDMPPGTSASIEIVDQEWHLEDQPGPVPAINTEGAQAPWPATQWNCQKVLMREGKPYTRTCAICKLGPCHFPSP